MTEPTSRQTVDDASNDEVGITSTISGKSSASKSLSASVLSISSTTTKTQATSLRDTQSGRTPEIMVLRRPSANQKRASRTLSGLTINKLKFNSIGVVGRDKEVALLKARLHCMMESTKHSVPVDESLVSASMLNSNSVHKELVLVSGWSGVGKTTLAKTLKQEIDALKQGGIFVEGKFDQVAEDDLPYYGIAKAFGELFRRFIDQLSAESILRMGKVISDELQEDIGLLIDLIPELEDIVSGYDTPIISVDMDFALGQDRWKNIFRFLTRVVASAASPVVLLLDDLQWSDAQSLEVIKAMVSDVQNPYPLLVLGCYRSNQADESGVLLDAARWLAEVKNQYRFNLTQVHLKECQLEDVNEIIGAMMSIDDKQRTLDLAAVCFKRTMGNPFFLIEFMKMLLVEGLITFNIGLLQWSWNIAKIENATMSTANVAELLEKRLEKLPSDAQLVLQYAACLGPSFRTSILIKVWDELSSAEESPPLRDSESIVMPILITLEEEMFIEACGSGQYRWVHDKVQEAALNFEASKVPMFQFEIGKTLLYALDEKTLEEELFNIADLFNRGTAKNNHEFAEINLRAAQKASSLGAFQSARKFVANGVAMLADDKWEVARPLTLALYTLGTQVELALGHIVASETYGNEVLGQKSLSLMDTFAVRVAKARTLASVEIKFSESIKSAVELLKAMNYKPTWNRFMVPVQTITTLNRTVKLIKRTPQDFFIKVGKMTDVKQQSIALVIAQIQYAAYNVDDLLLCLLANLRIIELSFRHGLCEFSGSCLAGLGAGVRLIQNDYRTSEYILDLALKTQRYFGGTRGGQTTYVAYACGILWIRQAHLCVQPFVEGYKLGLRSGDLVYGLWNLIAHSIFLPYTLGKPLDTMLEECPVVLTQLEEFKKKGHILVLKCFWQFFLNMKGHSQQSDAAVLNGNVYNEKDSRNGGSVLEGTVHLLLGEQLTLGANYEAAAKRALKRGKLFEKNLPGFFMIMIESFHRAVTLYAMAKKKRKYGIMANRLRRTIQGWHDKGNPNVVHFVWLLDAEQAALEKKHGLADALYNKAITSVARAGYLHHSGLISERYSDFLFREMNDKDEARYRLEEAIRYYEEWGALKVVERLRKSSLLG